MRLLWSVRIHFFFLLFFDVFFFFNDTATTEIYTLSLHDALPIPTRSARRTSTRPASGWRRSCARSEEHTSELQSRQYLVCRLLLEKKKYNTNNFFSNTITIYHASSVLFLMIA